MIESFLNKFSLRGLQESARCVLSSDHAPSLINPISQACTQSQMEESAFSYWCWQIFEKPRKHRKQWEYCYILQAAARCGVLAPGMRGLGFGVGGEPLTALFASRHLSILATDLCSEHAAEQGWVETAQHAGTKATLNDRGICPPDLFEQLVDFRFMDMNSIDPDITEFDFCWSACALEHLGSIEKGISFIRKSLHCLKPGGVAIHTTELNCSSDTDTLDETSTVLFRRRDFIELAEGLIADGHEISLNFDVGDMPLDKHVDVPPFSQDNHLKLQIDKWVTTSFGLIIRKANS